MIWQPIDELRLHREKEKRLQRGHAAVLRQDLLQEIELDEPVGRSRWAASRQVLSWWMPFYERIWLSLVQKWQKDELWIGDDKVKAKGS